MVTKGVRQCAICRTEFVINIKRNCISVQNYYLKANPVPLQFHYPISNQKAMGSYPSTQTQNNLQWILF